MSALNQMQPTESTCLGIDRSVLRDRRLPPGARIAYALVFDHICQHGGAWPSTALLAELLGVSHRQVRKYLAALEAAGYVSRLAGTSRPHFALRRNFGCGSGTIVPEERNDSSGRAER